MMVSFLSKISSLFINFEVKKILNLTYNLTKNKLLKYEQEWLKGTLKNASFIFMPTFIFTAKIGNLSTNIFSSSKIKL